jgi:uncharacterized protein (TIGR02145 family)
MENNQNKHLKSKKPTKMKRLLTTFLAVITSVVLFAQAPNAFNYQGVARDLTGSPIVNKNIGLRISILQGSTTGTEVYKELHLESTNNIGLFNIHIGYGTAVSDSIENINWGNGPFFLKIEMDTEGGSNYQLVGINQLLSVPYALYAENSGTQRQIDALEDMLIDAGLFTVKDVDGNTYKTVKIGDQIWMRENLKTTKLSNGDSIPYYSQSSSLGYCWHNHDIEYKDIFGAIYNYYTVNDPRGLCPTGWHVPSLGEWGTLINYLGGDSIAGGAMKETGTEYWDSPNAGATNSSGFSAIATGGRDCSGVFVNVGKGAGFYTSEPLVDGMRSAIILNYNNTKAVLGSPGFPCNSQYVRCIKD